jgi:hypothetical protein
MACGAVAADADTGRDVAGPAAAVYEMRINRPSKQNTLMSDALAEILGLCSSSATSLP